MIEKNKKQQNIVHIFLDETVKKNSNYKLISKYIFELQPCNQNINFNRIF